MGRKTASRTAQALNGLARLVIRIYTVLGLSAVLVAGLQMLLDGQYTLGAAALLPPAAAALVLAATRRRPRGAEGAPGRQDEGDGL